MTEIIDLKIINVPQPGSLSASFSNNLFGGYVAVRLLRPADECNIILQLRKELPVIRPHRRINSRFHPFIEISVPEYGSVKIPVRIPCRNSEIFQHMADFPAFKHILQMGYRGTGAGIKTLLIQSMRPLHIGKRKSLQSGIR